MTGRKRSLNGPRIDGLEDVEDETVEAAWDTEIGQRIDDLDSGRVKPISHAEFLRRLSRAIQTP